MPTHARRPAARNTAVGVAQVVGLALGTALAGWALLSNPGAPEAPGVAARVGVGMLAWILGAALAHTRPQLPGIALALAVGSAIVLGAPASLTGAPEALPLGYANANAALCAAAIAGLLGAATVTAGDARRWLITAALALLVCAVLTGSRAGAATGALLVLLWPLVDRGSERGWRRASGALLLTGLAAVVFVAARGATLRDSGMVASTVSAVRVDLWSDALKLANQHPVAGVGVGNFARLSATGRGDPDLAWAHSLPLQVFAELGSVGLVLLAAVTVWMVIRLGRASVVLTVLAMQPMVDYVVQLTPVLIAFCLVLGASSVTGFGRMPPPAAGRVRAGSSSPDRAPGQGP